MIAIASSNRIKLRKLILCSLSPYFKEDLKYLKKSWKPYVGKRRLKDLENIEFNKLYKKANGAILLVGNRESKERKRRVFDAHRKIKGSKLIEVKGARHNISQKEYLDSLKEIISKL